MRPFQNFRLWLRRASVGERVSAGLATAIVLALLVWVVVPAKSGRSSGALNVTAANGSKSGGNQASVASAGSQASGTTGSATATGAGGAGQAGAGGTGGGGGGGGTGGTTGGGSTSGGSDAATGTGGCTSPPGSDQGVSQSELKIVVVLVNLAGAAGNSTFGVPSTDEQKMDYQQVIDSINASGGVACRKLVPSYYLANPIDNSDLQSKCLDIVQQKPFFVVDGGGYYGSPISVCFPQHQLPFLSTGRLPESQRRQYYPYWFSTGTYDQAYRNMAFALRDRGFFSPSNGFKKLGFVYRDCFKEVNTDFLSWLNQVGVPSSQIVTYGFGCPQGFATPSDIQSAILKFRQAGVTHVTESQAYPDFANFTKVAQQQGFKPKYGLADDGLVPISTSQNLGDDYDNIDGAIAITGDRYGEETTPGLSPTPGTQKCDAIFTSKGRPPVYKQAVGFGGVACDELWMMQAAVQHAPSMQRAALAAGLQAAKSVDLAFPRGPADFSGARVTNGGQFWRPEQFVKGCGCWRVLDGNFKPSYS